ncbi:MAG: TonB family protein [Planctomycetota bacterium]|jgi:TonB family protein
MAATSIYIEPNLPWVETPEDRRFRRLSFTLLIIFMCLGLVLNMLTLPEPEQRKLIDVSPRLAKLILEKKKVVPPEPKIEKPKVEKKKEPEKKKEVKKKEAPKPKPKEKPKPTAREKAQKSGLIALSDELADLRDRFDLDDTIDLPQQTSGKKALKVATDTAILSSQAKQTSGGITTSNLTRKVESSELVSRKTTNVTSSIESSQQTKQKIAKASGKAASRSAEEIEQVFQKNKGGIFAIYNRALRKNPSLQGKVVIELTIDSNGVVSKVTIVSSELNDKKLEKKLALKIKKFKFAKANVARITVTYPIDFLPS